MSSSKILFADNKNDEYLIDATGLFLSEELTRIKGPRFPGQSPLAFSLGRFDKKKSKVEEIKNYPENTNIKTWVSNGTGNISTKAHKNHLKTLINNAMKEIK